MSTSVSSARRPILLTVEDLGVGGAQVFVLRLAQALHEEGAQVLIYSHYHHSQDDALCQQLAPDVEIVAYGQRHPRLDWMVRKTEGVLRRLTIRSTFRQRLVVRKLRNVVLKRQPLVVNSHTIKADYVAALALVKEIFTPLVITMHGCYELFLRHTDAAEVVPMGRYALQQAAAFVYLTDKNLEIFTQPQVRPLAEIPHHKIYNGFAGHYTEETVCSRAELDIGKDEMVFGMVARGIPEKGWEFAIQSFLAIHAEFTNTHLVLVGQSDYLTKLQAAYPIPHIHFVGHSPNPVDWIKLFDVALLPSYFHAESLPNSIAEYLFCGKPVIASRIGEVPQMLATATGTAGVVIDQDKWKLTAPDQLTVAMRTYIVHPHLLEEHRGQATQAFEKFRMDQCVAAYLTLYQNTCTAVRS